MLRSCLWFVLCALATALPARAQNLLIHSANVLSSDGDKWLERHDVLIENGKIARISESTITPTSDVPEISGANQYLIPGLIDLHSHLLLHPYNEAPWNDQVLKESLELRTIRATVAARATLQAGFTTLRDLGTEGAGFADVALRDAFRQHLVPGPRLYTTTRAIVARGCYGPAGFDPRWDLPQGAQEANGLDGVRAAVREQIAAGADWIKVYADYRRGRDAHATPTFSQDELNALVDEARSAGRLVAAHATTDEGIRRAVLAGVRTIEHGYGASETTLRLMKEHGVTLCPTLAAADAVARYAGWNGQDPPPQAVAESRAGFKRAMAVGVNIANGSDVGVFSHGDNARELELLVQNGMTAPAALSAATAGAARVLDRPDVGKIEPGSVADLVLIGGDPLAKISAVREVRCVIQSGVVVFRPDHATEGR